MLMLQDIVFPMSSEFLRECLADVGLAAIRKALDRTSISAAEVFRVASGSALTAERLAALTEPLRLRNAFAEVPLLAFSVPPFPQDDLPPYYCGVGVYTDHFKESRNAKVPVES